MFFKGLPFQMFASVTSEYLLLAGSSFAYFPPVATFHQGNILNFYNYITVNPFKFTSKKVHEFALNLYSLPFNFTIV